MTSHPPRNEALHASAVRQSAGRILDIFVIPVVALVIIGRSRYGAVPVIELSFLAITLIYAARFLLARAAAVRPNWIDWSLLLVALTDTISFFNSTYPTNSLHGYKETLFLLLFYSFVRLHLRHEYQRVGIFLLIALFGFLLSAAAIFYFRGEYKSITALGFEDLTNFKRFFNYFRPFGVAAGEWITIYLILLPFPILLFIRFAKKAAVAWLFLIPAVTMLLVISATFSRGVYVAAAAFFITAGLLFGTYGLTHFRRLIRFNLCALLILSAVLCLTPLLRPALTTASMFKTTSQVRSFEARVSLSRGSWGIVKQHTLFGVGALNFPMHSVAGGGDDSAYAGRVYNFFLQLLVEKGVVGLLAYCLLFLSFFKVSHDKVRLIRDDAFQQAAVALFMATFAALIVRDLSYSSLLDNEGVSTLLFFIFAHNALAGARPAGGGVGSPGVPG